jgi:hypothetical protein
VIEGEGAAKDADSENSKDGQRVKVPTAPSLRAVFVTGDRRNVVLPSEMGGGAVRTHSEGGLEIGTPGCGSVCWLQTVSHRREN